jgi:hypothetical protein
MVVDLCSASSFETCVSSDPVTLPAHVHRTMFALNNRGLLDGKLTGRMLTNTVCLAASSGFFLLGYDRKSPSTSTKEDLH